MSSDFLMRGSEYSKDDATDPELQTAPIAPTELKRNLYDIAEIQADGIPSPWNHALHFSWRLEEHDMNAFEDFELLLLGIFMGSLNTRSVSIESLGVFGEVLINGCPELGPDFILITHDDQPIGAFYPGCMLFPGFTYDGEVRTQLSLKNKELIALNKNEVGADPRIFLMDWLKNLQHSLGRLTRTPAWVTAIDYLITKYGGIDQITNSDATDKDKYVIYKNEINLISREEPIMVPIFVTDFLFCTNCNTNLAGIDGTQTLSGDFPSVSCTECNEIIPGTKYLGERGITSIDDRVIIWTFSNEYENELSRPFRGSLPKGVTDVSINEELGVATYKFGSFKINFQGELTSEKDILVEKCAYFENKEGEKIYADIPLRSEYVVCVKGHSRKLSDGGRSGTWSIHLSGQESPLDFEVELEKVEGPTSFYLWPNFYQENGWNINYYCLLHESSMAIVARPITKDYKLLDGIKNNEKGKSDIPVKYITFLIGSTESTMEEKGVFAHNRPVLDPVEGKRGHIAIDFGTTNTLVAIYRDTYNKPFPLVLQDRTVDILQTNIARQRLLKKEHFLPTLTSGDLPDSLLIIPSEIVVEPVPNEEELPVTITEETEFYIPHPTSLPRNVATNLKWGEKISSRYSQVWQILVKKYLGIVSHLALAEIAALQCSISKISITFPAAFGVNRSADYQKIWKDSLALELSKETGLQLNIEPSKGLLESDAGLKSCFRPQNDRLLVTADMGGGTTDITVSFGDKQNLFYYDSLKYAGEDLVNLLALVENLPTKNWILPNMPSSEHDLYKITDVTDKEANRQKINISIRNPQVGLARILEYGYGQGEDDAKLKKIKNSFRVFFDGLTGYLSYVIDSALASIKDRRVDEVLIQLLGNGWSLMKGTVIDESDLNKLTKYIQDRIQKNLVNTDIRVQVEVSRLQLTPDTEPVANPKAAVACGAIELANDSINRDFNLNKSSRQIPVGEDVKFKGLPEVEFISGINAITPFPIPDNGPTEFGREIREIDSTDFVNKFFNRYLNEIDTQKLERLIADLNHRLGRRENHDYDSVSRSPKLKESPLSRILEDIILNIIKGTRSQGR